MINRLTVKAIKAIKPRARLYKLNDGGGLYIAVKPNGNHVYKFRYCRPANRRENTLSIGPLSEVTLDTARQRRAEYRQQLRDGLDPGIIRHQSKQQRVVMTVGAVAREFIDKKRAGWSTSHTANQQRLLARHILPKLRLLDIAALDAQTVLRTIRGIEQCSVDIGHRCLALINQLFNYAIACGYISNNPCGALRAALAPSTPTQHYQAHTDAIAFSELLVSLETINNPLVRFYTQLLVLVFCRPSELRGAQWSEIDWDATTLTIPAQRMKRGGDHVIPLSRQAVDLLTELQGITGDSDYLFPHRSRLQKPMGASAAQSAVQQLGGTLHGFRATARTLLDEALTVPVVVIEQQLAHAVADANGRAYNRTRHLMQRADMMQRWADYLDTLHAQAIGDNVTLLRQPA